MRHCYTSTNLSPFKKMYLRFWLPISHIVMSDYLISQSACAASRQGSMFYLRSATKNTPVVEIRQLKPTPCLWIVLSSRENQLTEATI